jgi:hypothetical protein
MGRIADSVKKLDRESKRPQKAAKGGKPGRKVIPLMERERIAEMHILGATKRKIARETHHTQRSVARIIQESDIPAYCAQVRGEFVGLGSLAVTTLETEMRKGNFELAYRFLKDSGILADVQGRALAAKVAGVTPETTHAALDVEARELILNSLTDSDRQIFKVLQMFRSKSEAYSMPPIDVGLKISEGPAPAEQTPQELRGA